MDNAEKTFIGSFDGFEVFADNHDWFLYKSRKGVYIPDCGSDFTDTCEPSHYVEPNREKFETEGHYRGCHHYKKCKDNKDAITTTAFYITGNGALIYVYAVDGKIVTIENNTNPEGS